MEGSQLMFPFSHVDVSHSHPPLKIKKKIKTGSLESLEQIVYIISNAEKNALVF